ncbi:MAG: RagB/SusD family nutrient uptake outer membrane protein, partial [Planctomycetaceae bacterium]
LINALHDASGLPPFSSSDPQEIMDHIIQERSRQLFLTGHRVYDINRFDLPLIPAPGTEYPIKGGVYGDVRCMELPEVESVNNPNIGG